EIDNRGIGGHGRRVKGECTPLHGASEGVQIAGCKGMESLLVKAWSGLDPSAVERRGFACSLHSLRRGCGFFASAHDGDQHRELPWRSRSEERRVGKDCRHRRQACYSRQELRAVWSESETI